MVWELSENPFLIICEFQKNKIVQENRLIIGVIISSNIQ